MTEEIGEECNSNQEGTNSTKGGVKLPYFHRVLSPEETALIGDITPKPIVDKKITGAENAVPDGGKIGSAWNAAMTWEEKDCTSWAKSYIPTLFGSGENEETFKLVSNSSTSSAYNVQIKSSKDSISNVQGHAQITHSRGKPRFMYELSFDLEFTVSLSNDASAKIYSGKISIVDVINDQLDDIDYSLTWNNDASPPGAILVPMRNAVIGKSSGLHDHIKQKMVVFEAEFRNSQQTKS